jgi:hypothetical protein
VKIKFSRHARRRAELYGIPLSIVTGILEGMPLRQGVQDIVEEVDGFKYPLKIVTALEEDETVVITVYPLKKGRKP